MKQLLVVFLFIGISVSTYGQTPVKIGDLVKKDKIYTYHNIPYTGACYDKHENGKIGLKGQFKDGMKDGVWTWWYSSGKKLRETSYIENKKEGLTFYWHPNGQKAKELIFKSDKNIDQKLWDENGVRLPNPTFSQTLD